MGSSTYLKLLVCVCTLIIFISCKKIKVCLLEVYSLTKKCSSCHYMYVSLSVGNLFKGTYAIFCNLHSILVPFIQMLCVSSTYKDWYFKEGTNVYFLKHKKYDCWFLYLLWKESER